MPQTFELATELIRPGGRVANIGVHGEPVTLHLEKLWIRNVTITTGLVDTYTIPQLMKLVASGRLDPTIFATHRFALGDTMAAYDTFADAATTDALKVVLEGSERDPGANGRVAESVVAGPHDPAHRLGHGTATWTRGRGARSSGGTRVEGVASTGAARGRRGLGIAARALRRGAARRRAGGVPARDRAWARAARRAHVLERQLDRARRRRRRDAALAASATSAAPGSTRAGWSIDGRRRVLRASPSACTTACTASGDGGPLGEAERDVYERRCAANARAARAADPAGRRRAAPRPADRRDDPAPARDRRAGDLARHIGLDLPNDVAREAWRFLIPYVEQADAYVFSRDASRVGGPRPRPGQRSSRRRSTRSRPKNQAMAFTSVDRGAARRRPGRRPPPARRGDVRAPRRQRRPRRATRADDRGGRAAPRQRRSSPRCRAGTALKDPVGVLAGFAEHVRPERGPASRARRPGRRRRRRRPRGRRGARRGRGGLARACPAMSRRRVHLALLPMDDADENAVIVNALQRRADVVVQKSLAEGFGLTVAEAMWKGRPVVATRVGGIQDQIEDGRTGCLVDPHDLAAFGDARERACSPTRTRAERMGAAGADTRARPLPRPPPPRRSTSTCSSASRPRDAPVATGCWSCPWLAWPWPGPCCWCCCTRS